MYNIVLKELVKTHLEHDQDEEVEEGKENEEVKGTIALTKHESPSPKGPKSGSNVRSSRNSKSLPPSPRRTRGQQQKRETRHFEY